MGEKRVSKWYFGGLASAGAAAVTHPLDLIKVQLQTQQDKKTSMSALVRNMIKTDGVLSLYNGISASLLRQLTYSTSRFAIYEVGKQALTEPGKTMSFPLSVALAGVAGAFGGIVGTPADLVNVRMQNDMKLPPDQRRNYKHAVDGLWQVASKEGPSKLMSGATAASVRATFMTIGQLAFYDLFKDLLLSASLKDNSATHFLASLAAGGVATVLTQPLDVIKTRIMNAKPGEYSGMMDVALKTAKLGPLAFFKGFVPAFVRLAPQTILVFQFLEKLRENFGTIVQEPKKLSAHH